MTGYPERPVLVGMNNPYRSEPEYALYPWPENSAGGRLYVMFCEAYERRFGCDYPARRKGYLETFDRRNVLSATKWTASGARRQGAALVQTLAGRRVVVLGRQAAKAMGLLQTEWFWTQECTVASPIAAEPVWLTAWTIPHPSGMCREYNDPAVRARAGDLLLELCQQTGPFGDVNWRV